MFNSLNIYLVQVLGKFCMCLIISKLFLTNITPLNNMGYVPNSLSKTKVLKTTIIGDIGLSQYR